MAILTASGCETDNMRFTLFCVFTAIDWQRLEADMNMLLNTYIKRGCYSPPYIGFASNAFPKPKGSDIGVSLEYGRQEGHEGFGSSCHLRRVSAAVVTAELCHYKSGDKVRVIAGIFKGIVGKVARIAGLQRVVLNILGLCFVATAYISTAYLETLE